MNNIFRLFSSPADSIRCFGIILGLLGAVILLAAVVAAGFFVPTKVLGVSLASVGGFIRMLLSPVNKPVVFVDTPLSEIEHEVGWFGIEDFAKEHNRLLKSNKTEATA